MNTHKIINFLMTRHLHHLSRFIVKILSIVLKSNVRNSIIENKYWLQEYKIGSNYSNNKFIDFVPNYRTNSYQDAKKLCDDVAFSHYKPKLNDICIDIGAGIGTESIFMSKLVGSGKVYSIEAFREVFDVLNMNIKYNNLHNVNTYNLAISNSNEYVYITDNDSHIENKVASNDLSDNVRKVKSITIDQFIKDHEIRQIDFLKVNIEGSEKELIKCFNKVTLVKNVAISCHDFLVSRTGDTDMYTKDKVVAFLKANNFIVSTLNTPNDWDNDWIFGVNGS
jgi:FkbM family methyltransferase